MRTFLHKLMVDITRHPREVITPTWSAKSWTHNVFRVYEYWFGRRAGIRISIAASSDGTQIAYSFEAQCALLETWVRNLRYWRSGLSFKIVVIPQLQLAGMGQAGILPYRFAIAFDTAVLGSNGGGTTTASWSHTCTGSNLLLITASNGNSSSTQDIISYTYNSVGLTIAGTGIRTGGTTSFLTMWGLINPTTGANTVVVTFPSGQAFNSQASFSYTGVKQSGFPDSYHTTTTAGSGTTDSGSTTTVANNCWLVGLFSDTTGRTDTASTNTTQRITRNGEGYFIGDTNAAQTPAGSYSLNITISASVTGRTNIVLSIAPFGAVTLNNGFFFTATR